jgi:hypothetical protein
MIRVLLSSAVALIMIAPACGGQTPEPPRSGGLDLLAIPSGELFTCYVPEVNSPRAAGAVIREFRFGSVTPLVPSWPREITVLFDSVGRPRFVSDEVSHGPRGSQTIIAELRPDGQITGKSMLITVDSVAQADAMARGDLKAALATIRPPVSRALLPSEAARVRPLAIWLWEHRCGRSSK